MHYYIIGTAHELQKASNQDRGLRTKLEDIVSANHVVLIAEEVNANQGVCTFGRELIGNDKWLSIDMTDQQRRDAGIYDRLSKDHPPEFDPASGSFRRVNAYYREAEATREHFWLEKIEAWCKERQLSEGTIIITCGHNHLKFLPEKVDERGHGHTVTTDEYMPFDVQAEYGVFRVVE